MHRLSLVNTHFDPIFGPNYKIFIILVSVLQCPNITRKSNKAWDWEVQAAHKHSADATLADPVHLCWEMAPLNDGG